MKIIRWQDVCIKTKSDFDWDGFIDAFDWGALYDSCLMDTCGYTRDDDEWGVPVVRGGYRLTSLDLPLTSEDMKAIREKCSPSFFYLESARPVFKLIENLLFVVDDIRGLCWAVVRFQPTESGYVAVEFLEATEETNSPELHLSVEFIAQWISELLPNERFDVIYHGIEDIGLCWKEAGDPEHEPNTQLFRDRDIAVLEGNDFDWNNLLDSFDWSALYQTCSANWWFAETHNDWGHRVVRNGYRLIVLNLMLSNDDMKAIAAASNEIGAEWHVGQKKFWLADKLLFVIDDDEEGICCNTIIRFEQTEAGWRTVEYIEDTVKRELVAPLISAARIAQLLHGRLEGRSRFGWIDKDDPNQGWYWRDAGNFLEVLP